MLPLFPISDPPLTKIPVFKPGANCDKCAYIVLNPVSETISTRFPNPRESMGVTIAAPLWVAKTGVPTGVAISTALE